MSFGAALAALLLIACIAGWNAVRFDGTSRLVEHTYKVLDDLHEIYAGVLRMQGGVRGYLVTGRDEMLVPVRKNRSTVTATLDHLHGLVSDNPRQTARAATLTTVVSHTLSVLDDLVQARRAHGLDAVRQAPILLHGQNATTQVRAIIAEMNTEERRLLAERIATTRRFAFATIGTTAVGGAVAIVLVFGAGLVVRRDYRARQAVEAALRLSEESVRQTLEGIRDYAIMRLDPDGCVRSWNPGAEKILGYRADEVLGQSIARFYPEESAGLGAARELQEAATSGRFEDYGWRVRRDGTRFWANVILTVIRDREGRLVGFVKIAQDLTDSRRAEEEIRSLNRDLRRQNDRLEYVNKELEAFSYSVSHDLRAPLRHIDGFATLLSKHSDTTLDEKGRRYVTVISEAAKRMGRLIDDLLTFSRMGRAQLELVELDHRALVAGVIRDGGYDREAKIGWQIAPLPRVYGDAAMLRQVWQNLVDNAVKYSSRSPAPRIEIGGGPVNGSGEQVFFIRDNGVGFDMKYVGKLFGVFQRLHSSTEFDGTGIGLANVRRIVVRHGGRIWAESSVGGGATFSFSLPDRATDQARSNQDST